MSLSEYPAAVDTWPTIIDGVAQASADWGNKVQDAIYQLQVTGGAGLAGGHADLDARLDYLEAIFTS